MSHFVTQTGTVVTCADPYCICASNPSAFHFMPRVKPVTAGGVDADAEERWFSELCDAIEEYLHLYVQHRESPKADRDAIEVEMHAAKADVIARFYGAGGAL